MGKSIITAYQKRVIEEISEDKFIRERFYLTGGTALAGFYLFHRYSEDLDFFSESEFDVSGINVFFRKHKKTLMIKKIDFQQSYNRNLFFYLTIKEF